MSRAVDMVCDRCARRYGLDAPETLCRACGGLLEVTYDLAGLTREELGGGRGLWRWRELLPLAADAEPVTLGEGDTPLLDAPRLAARLGVRRLWLKDDTLMPTGSFKDRGMSVAVSVARSLGVRRAMTYSSGNAGASLAAYAARAGLDVVVLVEYIANAVKVAAIQAYGARVVRLRFASSAEIFAALEAVADTAPYTFVNFMNPVRHEAMKTYAYEVCEALGWRAPDVMIHPIGTGGGLYGAWKGFRELRELGWIARTPRMIGVQPSACAPIAEAVASGAERAGRSGDAAATIAQSIAGDAPLQGGERVLRAIRDSDGTALAVDDDALLDAMRALGGEGVAAEPSAAASLAALRAGLASGAIDPGEEVVCVVTGSALKQPDALLAAAGDGAEEVPATEEALRALVGAVTAG